MAHVANIFIPNVSLNSVFLLGTEGTTTTSLGAMASQLRGAVNISLTPAKTGDGFDLRLSETSNFVSSLKKVGGVIADTPKYIVAAGMGIGCGALTAGHYAKTGLTFAAKGVVKGGKFLYRGITAAPGAIRKAFTTYPGRIGGVIKSGFRIAIGAIKRGGVALKNGAQAASYAARSALGSSLHKLATTIEPGPTSSLSRQPSIGYLPDSDPLDLKATQNLAGLFGVANPET